MNCCGNKRNSLRFIADNNPVMKHQSSQFIHNKETVNSSRENKLFRYTGTGSLEINSFLNRKVYQFSASNPNLIVFAEDVAMLRGYPELIESDIK